LESLNEWRLLDLGAVNPHENQVMEELLIDARRKNLIPDTLNIRMPGRYVEVGQKASLSEINLDFCRSEGIPVVREGVLGGSVHVYGETLPFAVVSREHLNRKTMMACLIESLRVLGLSAHIKQGSNNILTGGKKVASTGDRIIDGVFIGGASILSDFDFDFCKKVIKKPKDHRGKMTTLRAQLGREVSYDEVVAALKAGFESVLQVEFVVSNSLTEAEEIIIEGLLVKYRSDEWLRYGKWSPVKDYWRPK